MPSAAETARRAAGNGEPLLQVSANTLIRPSPMNFRCRPPFFSTHSLLRSKYSVRSSATSPELSFSASDVRLRMSQNSTVAVDPGLDDGTLGRFQAELVVAPGRRSF